MQLESYYNIFAYAEFKKKKKKKSESHIVENKQIALGLCRLSSNE